MRGNDAIAQILKAEGAEYLFCFPDNQLIHAAAAVGIRPMMSRTERATVNMADGYTRMMNGRRNGVVVTQSGPGIENAYGGIAHAYSDSVPILVIPGERTVIVLTSTPAPAEVRTPAPQATLPATPTQSFLPTPVDPTATPSATPGVGEATPAPDQPVPTLVPTPPENPRPKGQGRSKNQ